MMIWALFRRLTRPALVLAVLLAIAAPAAAQGGTSHTVQSGENLFRIALRYNTTVEALSAANGITDPGQIYAGQVLIIPGAATAPAPVVVNPAPDGSSPIVLESGPGVSAPAADAVAAAPVVPVTVNPVPVAAAPVYHTVQPGETLASIGRAYGLDWTALAAANGITDPNHIFYGQQLTIPGASAPGTAAAAPPVNPAPAEPAPAPVPVGTERTHVVQGGESLASIGRTYGISWPTIARANGITDPNHIFSGQTLVIPATDDGQGTYLQPNTWAPAAAAPTITTGKQIVVDLSDQRVYAYENGNMVRNVLVSTGLYNTPTVQGDYRIYIKYPSQTMSGPGYYLPGVPYVMYFYQGYSLHGTYWHNNFGQPMSHGCVNLPTPEAEWFYNWAEMGTPVRVEW
ncbi:MAG: LysM peptidoglycan-binding domain-containing protein [Chloroflexi bacterium]|nr:LysM peptidoglycan-binding domain-containing protein [Chloroflexota bacterium]